MKARWFSHRAFLFPLLKHLNEPEALADCDSEFEFD